MIKNIPRKRLLLYGLIAGFFPLIFIISQFALQKERLDLLENRILSLHDKALIQEKKQASNKAVMDHYKDADHFYIDKNLETLTFLEPEIESLQRLVSNKNFAFDDTFSKRLDQLTGSNSLAFTEGVVQSSPLYQETTETLVHPVEANLHDIQEILARIEGDPSNLKEAPLNSPQLIILDFKIDRKSLSEKNETYTLNLKLLKREFL